MTLHVRIIDTLNRKKCELRVASAAEPARLVDCLDDAEQYMPWLACRSARCGVCRVRVLQGPETLLAAGSEELETLAFLAADAGERLACQLRLASDASGELGLRLSVPQPPSEVPNE